MKGHRCEAGAIQCYVSTLAHGIFARCPSRPGVNEFLYALFKLFYINHIKENHKGEYKGTLWLLEKLKNGISTRIKINAELNKDYNSRWRFKDQVVNTQRAGLMARMTELGLIGKIKKGIKVKYLISKYGQEVLEDK